MSLRNPNLLLQSINMASFVQKGNSTSSEPISEHVILSRRRHYVCVPRLFFIKMEVSDKQQSVPFFTEHERI